MIPKKEKRIHGAPDSGFRYMFDEIRNKRPDLGNDNEVIKEAVRQFYKSLTKDKIQITQREIEQWN